jgi:hypothetical protein
MKLNSIRFLNGNMLKILAAIFMVVDHVGLLFFPYEPIFRIIGRLAYPIFAFMISEGAKYTRNKLKYIGTIGGLALICQLVYFFFANSLYMCILVTFTLSIATIYALSYFKQCIFDDHPELSKCLLSGGLLIFSIWMLYHLNQQLTIDYGFIGCMIPVIASVFDLQDTNIGRKYKWLNSYLLKVGMLALGLLWLAIDSGGIQMFSLLAIPLLLCYSEKRGTAKLKYFFYVFYPVHLVVLEGIAIAVALLK